MVNNEENSFRFISEPKEVNSEFSIYYQGKNFGNSSKDNHSKHFAVPTGTYDNFKLNYDENFKITFDTQIEKIKIEKQ